MLFIPRKTGPTSMGQANGSAVKCYQLLHLSDCTRVVPLPQQFLSQIHPQCHTCIPPDIPHPFQTPPPPPAQFLTGDTSLLPHI